MGTIGLARLHFEKVKKVSRLLSPRPRVFRPSTFLELRAHSAKVQTACGSKVLVCLTLLDYMQGVRADVLPRQRK